MTPTASLHHRLDCLADAMARSITGRGDRSPAVVLAAVSGGADSTFLLRMLHRALQDTACTVHVCHVDHGYRPDSAAEAASVKSLAARLNLPFQGLELTDADRTPMGSRQARWREGRYRLLTETARRLAAPGQTAVIATGHHAGDQVETLLMNLIRGTHLSGLRGMEEWSSLAAQFRQTGVEVLLWRPLLAWTPDDIRSCLEAWNETWEEDRSNRDESHLRNRVRHRVVPQLTALRTNTVGFLANQMELWRPDIQALERIHADNLARSELFLPQPNIPRADQSVILRLAPLRNAPPWQQRGMLAQAVARLHRNRQLSAARLDELCRQLETANGSLGPRPWFGDLCWSVWHRPPARVFDLPTSQDLLSLHRRGSMPFPVNVPRLPPDWRHAPIPLAGADLRLPGWTLSATPCEHPPSMSKMRDDPYPWMVYLDLTSLAAHGNSIRLEPAIPQLRLQPLGMKAGRKQIRHILRDDRIHVSLRADWPVVYAEDGNPVWVCGLRHAAAYAVREPGRPVLRLCWHPHP